MNRHSADGGMLKILHLEDSPRDAEIIRERLVEDGFAIQLDWASNEPAYTKFLAGGRYDLILADFHLPGFDAHDALALASAHCPDVPFICISGAIGEENAVDLLRRGATDYVLKDRLEKLPLAIGRALDEVRERNERKRAEEELRRLSTAIEQAAEDILITDPEGVIQYVNPAFEKLTGYTRQEAIGNTPRILKSGHHQPAFYEELWRTIKNGRIWSGRIVNRCKDGRLIHEDATISPLLSSSGALTGYIALKRDVTDAVRMENQLRQAQKMEAIGTLAGGIAHDFNNILAGMIGYAELARFKTADTGVHQYLDQILQAGARATDLVRQILTFSRQAEQEKQPLRLTPLIQEVMKFLRASLPATIAIRYRLNAPSDLVLADQTQMHQLLINLCMNAAHAMRQRGGTIDIATEAMEIDAQDPDHPALAEGRYIRLTVHDTGHGIEASLLNKIFEPYFSTKAKGEGTGLGLSVADGIVKSHGGAIKVHSEVDNGTTFLVYLPILDGGADALGPEETNPILGGSETILFIDDENMLAQAARLALEGLGYTVIVKTDAVEALEWITADGRDLDLVITDKTMPRLTGFDVAREIRRTRKDLPILMCSGFQDKGDLQRAAELGIDQLMGKPVTIRTLAETVRSVLDRRSNPTETHPRSADRPR